MKLSDILGLNSRNFIYTSRYNRTAGKKIADNKLLTKSALKKANLATPRLYKVITNEADLNSFDFSKIGESFVIKPNRGLGGKGIIVIEKPGKKPGTWITSERSKVTLADLQLHILDILEGSFSMNDAPDIAYVEERVRIHPAFADYAYRGTPDIGVLVFNRIPVMAFLRLPTKESAGRANLFQGAVACGIDIAAGVTTHSIQHTETIAFFPGTRKRLAGILIPEWDKVLKLAIQASEASGLGYMRADIVLQPSLKTPGKTIPKILELNAQPGLKIQLCNKAGLRRRLERVEDLEVESPEKGIRIAKELFGDKRIMDKYSPRKSIGVFETILIEDANGKTHEVKVKVDTGADRSSIDRNLAESLGLLAPENVLFTRHYESALGTSERPIIKIKYKLAGKSIDSTASVADRTGLKRSMLVGRKDLKGFVIEF